MANLTDEGAQLGISEPRQIAEIHARLKAIREDYAVHIGCGGEAIPTTPIGTHYNCQRCGKRLPCDDIAEKMDPALSYVEDVEWLLQTISELKEALAVERQCRQVVEEYANPQDYLK